LNAEPGQHHRHYLDDVSILTRWFVARKEWVGFSCPGLLVVNEATKDLNATKELNARSPARAPGDK